MVGAKVYVFQRTASNRDPAEMLPGMRCVVEPVATAPFHKLCSEKWQFEIELYFIRFEAALKSEIRISKRETNSND